MNPSMFTRRQALHRIGAALGGIVTAPLVSGLLGGCRVTTGDDAVPYTYQTLTGDQQRAVAALVDQIIPATDTPGASEVGVPQFIDKMLTEWYAPEERDAFLAGLANIQSSAAGGNFVDLDAAAQAALVARLDREAYPDAPAENGPDGDVAGAAQEGTYQAGEEAENEVAGMQGDLGEAQSDSAATELSTGEGTVMTGGDDDGPPFFVQLKELTLAGYYTSEAGATEELRWNPAPGRYDADVPLSEIGRAWA